MNKPGSHFADLLDPSSQAVKYSASMLWNPLSFLNSVLTNKQKQHFDLIWVNIGKTLKHFLKEHIHWYDTAGFMKTGTFM